MVTVYRVVVPVETHQSFHTDDGAFFDSYYPRIHKVPIGSDWRPPSVYFHRPRLPEGHFVGFVTNLVFAVRAQLVRECADLHSFFEQSGELLRFSHKGVKYLAFNCTNCLNAFDDTKAAFYSPSRQIIKQYAFHPSRFTFSLFTIPESRELLCVEGLGSPHDEFKGFVEERAFTGLIFEKLWSDGPPKKRTKGKKK